MTDLDKKSNRRYFLRFDIWNRLLFFGALTLFMLGILLSFLPLKLICFALAVLLLPLVILTHGRCAFPDEIEKRIAEEKEGARLRMRETHHVPANRYTDSVLAAGAYMVGGTLRRTEHHHTKTSAYTTVCLFAEETLVHLATCRFSFLQDEVKRTEVSFPTAGTTLRAEGYGRCDDITLIILTAPNGEGLSFPITRDHEGRLFLTALKTALSLPNPDKLVSEGFAE